VETEGDVEDAADLFLELNTMMTYRIVQIIFGQSVNNFELFIFLGRPTTKKP
jgi:hypothetical protein